MLLGATGWETECAVYNHLKLAKPADVTGPCDASNVAQYRKAQEAQSKPVDNKDNGVRYSLNLDGTGVSERMSHQLASSQLVFKVDSPFYNYYSRFFLPYVHYVPVKYDLSDLAEKVRANIVCLVCDVHVDALDAADSLTDRSTNRHARAYTRRWSGPTRAWRRRTR